MVDTTQWFYSRNGLQYGPVDITTLTRMIVRGEITRESLVWMKEMPDWQLAGSVLKLRHLFLQMPSTSSESGASLPILQGTGQRVYAGFWLRWVALLIDVLLLSVCSCFVAAPLVGGLRPHAPGATIGAQVLMNLFAVIVGWLYHALMESSPYQATIGKMAVGIIVTDENEQRITFGRATGRHFGKILSGLILCMGYVMAAFTEKKQALHDLLARTLVVRK